MATEYCYKCGYELTEYYFDNRFKKWMRKCTNPKCNSLYEHGYEPSVADKIEKTFFNKYEDPLKREAMSVAKAQKSAKDLVLSGNDDEARKILETHVWSNHPLDKPKVDAFISDVARPKFSKEDVDNWELGGGIEKQAASSKERLSILENSLGAKNDVAFGVGNYIIIHRKYPQLKPAAEKSIQHLQKNGYLHLTSDHIYSSLAKPFSGIDLSGSNNLFEDLKQKIRKTVNSQVHLEIKLFSNGVNVETAGKLIEEMSKDYLSLVYYWSAKGFLTMQFAYDESAAKAHDKSLTSVLKNAPGRTKNFFRHFFPKKMSEDDLKAYIRKSGDRLLAEPSYRKYVRDFCPRCKAPTLLARYKIGNAGESANKDPDWYECSSCHYVKKSILPKFMTVFRFKTEKLNWISIAPKFMVFVLGMFLFSWILITFGGGTFGGDYWIFAIIGTILGLISMILDFLEIKREKKKEGKIIAEATGGEEGATKAPEFPATAETEEALPNGYTRKQAEEERKRLYGTTLDDISQNQLYPSDENERNIVKSNRKNNNIED